MWPCDVSRRTLGTLESSCQQTPECLVLRWPCDVGYVRIQLSTNSWLSGLELAHRTSESVYKLLIVWMYCCFTLLRFSGCTVTPHYPDWLYVLTLPRLYGCSHPHCPDCLKVLTLPRLFECTHTTQIVWMYPHYPDCLDVPTLPWLSGCTHTTQIVWMYPHYPDCLDVPTLPTSWTAGAGHWLLA